MNIIVTGGAGFIGSNFVYYELKKHPEELEVQKTGRALWWDKPVEPSNAETITRLTPTGEGRHTGR